MAYTRSIFSQLLQWIPSLEFQKAVNAHQGDYRVRKLRTWSQFVALLFAQLTGHHSLRPIEAGMRSARESFDHLGCEMGMRFLYFLRCHPKLFMFNRNLRHPNPAAARAVYKRNSRVRFYAHEVSFRNPREQVKRGFGDRKGG